VDVGGVAGQEDPADPVGEGLAFVAVEAGQPAGLVHAEVGAECPAGDLFDFVECQWGVVGDVVVALPAEDPVVAVAEWGDECEGVADAVDGEHGAGLLGEADVGEHDGADYRLAGEWQSEGGADGAVVAVGADQVGGVQRGLGAVVGAGPGGDAVGVLVEVGQFGVVAEVHSGFECAGLEQVFHFVLWGDRQVGEAAG
jgi:hypothetical protein